MANISSPFDSALGTPTQNASGGGGAGAVPGPAPDWPLNQVMPTSVNSATWDSPYNEGLVQSVNTVTSLDPGGTAPMESPFKDGLAKR